MSCSVEILQWESMVLTGLSSKANLVLLKHIPLVINMSMSPQGKLLEHGNNRGLPSLELAWLGISYGMAMSTQILGPRFPAFSPLHEIWLLYMIRKEYLS